MHLHVERVTPPATAGMPRSFQLSLVGNDRPGIVREISRALHELSVNVEQLNTECVPAPMSSEELFKAEATLRVPPELDIAVLQQRLETLADDLIVDISLRDSS
jgi:glycine cleavage system regulatory protein